MNALAAIANRARNRAFYGGVHKTVADVLLFRKVIANNFLIAFHVSA